jgi:Virulence factor BrkB/Bacterial regulatory proteins, gntR family
LILLLFLVSIPALVGSAVSALLFLGAKKAFAFYVEQFASYDVVYGAISSIPIFLLWLYVTWVIVLFGCEVAYQVQCAGSAAAVAPRSVVTVGIFADHISHAVIEAMKKRFDAGEAPYTEYELAQEFGMSHVVLRPVLRSLVTKGLVYQAGENLTFGINPRSTSP